MVSFFDLESTGFEIELDPVVIDLSATGFELDLQLEPVNLDCFEYQPADTGGANEPF